MTDAIRLEGVGRRFVRRTHKGKRQALAELRHTLFSRSGPDTFWALRDITFSVEAGERVGILGHNGAGKSTLLKILAGTLPPSEGTVRVHGKVAPLLSLTAGFTPQLTGRENVFLNASLLGLSRKEIKRRYEQIVAFAEVEEFIDDPLMHFSSGMRARLGFSVAAHLDADIMLLDEVLAVGDADFKKKCEKRIQEQQEAGRTFVLVTHSANVLRRFCDRGLVLRQGRIVAQGDVADLADHLPDAERARGQAAGS